MALDTPALVLAIALSLQVISLLNLEFWRTRLEQVSFGEVRHSRRSLHLGGLRWDDRRPDQGGPSAPQRFSLGSGCESSSAPLARAVCLTNALASRCPHGTSAGSILDPTSDYHAMASRHLAGAPCDATTRSSILAAALLEAGTPARVVRMMNPAARISHTAIELHDGERGWILFDPLFAGTVATPTGSDAAAVLESPDSIRFERLARTPRDAGDEWDGQRFYQGAPGEPRSTHLLYPDPWLYTRAGDPWAGWPFSARYVVVGPQSWHLGVAQRVLFALVPLTAIGLALVLIAGRSSSGRRHDSPKQNRVSW